MTDFDNIIDNNELSEELDCGVVTLTDTVTGEEKNFVLCARAVLEGKLYYALKEDNEESDEFTVLCATEDGEDLLFETIEDDDEYDMVEDYFNDLLFGEIDYDEV